MCGGFREFRRTWYSRLSRCRFGTSGTKYLGSRSGWTSQVGNRPKGYTVWFPTSFPGGLNAHFKPWHEKLESKNRGFNLQIEMCECRWQENLKLKSRNFGGRQNE